MHIHMHIYTVAQARARLFVLTSISPTLCFCLFACVCLSPSLSPYPLPTSPPISTIVCFSPSLSPYPLPTSPPISTIVCFPPSLRVVSKNAAMRSATTARNYAQFLSSEIFQLYFVLIPLQTRVTCYDSESALLVIWRIGCRLSSDPSKKK